MINNKFIKITVFILILVFYGSLLVHKIELPSGDDMGRHLKNGELILHGDFRIIYSNLYTYTEPEHPFVNHNWLFAVMAYLVYLVTGWTGLTILKIIVLLSAFCLVFSIAVRKSNFWLASFLSVPTIMILMARTTLRPEMMSFLFIAATLYLLADLDEHPRNNKIFWLVPIQLLWVNMHLFFIVGITMVGGFLIEKISKNYNNIRKNQVIKKLSVLLLALFLVTLINPNGLTGALYPVNIFNNYGIDVLENNPPSYFLKINPPFDNIPIIIFEWAVVIFAVSLLINLKNFSLFYFLFATATAIGGFAMFRLLSFFGLIFLPATSYNLKNSFSWLEKNFNKSFSVINLARVAVVIFILSISYLIVLVNTGGLLSNIKPGLGLIPNSNQAADFFVEKNIEGPIFNDFDSGSYLINRLYPKWKIFVDNRPESHSSTFLAETYLPVLFSEDAWKKIDNQYGFNSIFIYIYTRNNYMRNFVINRINDPNWSLVFANSYNLIFVRNNLINKRITDEYKITAENVQVKLETLLSSQDYDEQVAAADIFNLFGRFDLGSMALSRVAQSWPEKGKVWLVLGGLEFDKNPQLAVVYFERAISVGYKTPKAYAALGDAYKRIGANEKAEEAYSKALKIDPTYFDYR